MISVNKSYNIVWKKGKHYVIFFLENAHICKNYHDQTCTQNTNEKKKWEKISDCINALHLYQHNYCYIFIYILLVDITLLLFFFSFFCY